MASPEIEKAPEVQQQPQHHQAQAVAETQDYQKSNPAFFRPDQNASDNLIKSGALPAITFGQFDGRMDGMRQAGMQNGFKFDESRLGFTSGEHLMNGIMLTRDSNMRTASTAGGERTAPESKETNSRDTLAARLMDGKATPKERLEAARELVKSGVTKIDGTTDDGRKASLRLDASKAGDKEMVHVFVNKGNRESVALRGNFDEKGDLSKQQRGGKAYSYEGKGQRDLNHMSFKPEAHAPGRAAEAPVKVAEVPKVQAPAAVRPETPRAQVQAQSKPAEAPKVEAPRAQAPAQSGERPLWPRTLNRSQEPAQQTPEAQKPAEAPRAAEGPQPTAPKPDGPKPDAAKMDAPKSEAPGTAETAKPEQVKLKGGLKPVVILDAGHGGTDSGAVVNGTQEKEVTRQLTDLVTSKLRERGVMVEHTNPTDNYISPTDRRDRANVDLGAIAGRKQEHACQADAAISIHANHDGVHNKGGGATRGLEVLLNGGKGKDGTLDLAKSIEGSVVKARDQGLDVVDGGLRNRPGLAFTKALSPTVLVEAGYLTNNRDLANLKDPVYRDKLATAITNGIAQFLQDRPANCRKR